MHSIQHSDCKGIPQGLVEGIADALRMQVGLSAGHWKEAEGQITFDWHAGYECASLLLALSVTLTYSMHRKTAFFLDWVQQHTATHDFIPKLNRAIAQEDLWSEDIFEKITNGQHSLRCLWSTYKQERRDKARPVWNDGYRVSYAYKDPRKTLDQSLKVQ